MGEGVWSEKHVMEKGEKTGSSEREEPYDAKIAKGEKGTQPFSKCMMRYLLSLQPRLFP